MVSKLFISAPSGGAVAGSLSIALPCQLLGQRITHWAEVHGALLSSRAMGVVFSRGEKTQPASFSWQADGFLVRGSRSQGVLIFGLAGKSNLGRTK